MQAKWEREVRELLRSEVFRAWLRRYHIVREELKNARLKRNSLDLEAQTLALQADATQRLGDERLFAAGEAEDAAARAQAAHADIENSSFEKLSRFELERSRATGSWQEADRLEKLLDDDRQKIEELRDRADKARRAQSAEGNNEADRIESRMRELQEGLARKDKEVAQAREKMNALTHDKERLWEDVQVLWGKAFRAQMERSEWSFQSRRARAEAESLFGQQAAERHQIDQAKKERAAITQRIRELEEQYADAKKNASEEFHCALLDEFMFWPQQENVQGAWVVSLFSVTHHLNIQVHELQLCQCDRQKGLDLIEPVPDEHEASREDARLEAFFHK